MSYKSREKKRQLRAAQQKGRQAQRAKHADRHYLTIITRPCCCNSCGGSLRDGAECVYRHTPREIPCIGCAQQRKISYRPSLRWERAHTTADGKPKPRGRRQR